MTKARLRLATGGATGGRASSRRVTGAPHPARGMATRVCLQARAPGITRPSAATGSLRSQWLTSFAIGAGGAEGRGARGSTPRFARQSARLRLAIRAAPAAQALAPLAGLTADDDPAASPLRGPTDRASADEVSPLRAAQIRACCRSEAQADCRRSRRPASASERPARPQAEPLASAGERDATRGSLMRPQAARCEAKSSVLRGSAAPSTPAPPAALPRTARRPPRRPP